MATLTIILLVSTAFALGGKSDVPHTYSQNVNKNISGC